MGSEGECLTISNKMSPELMESDLILTLFPKFSAAA